MGEDERLSAVTDELGLLLDEYPGTANSPGSATCSRRLALV
jgi:hypothetical protein